jgi:hypothetical protein
MMQNQMITKPVTTTKVTFNPIYNDKFTDHT